MQSSIKIQNFSIFQFFKKTQVCKETSLFLRKTAFIEKLCCNFRKDYQKKIFSDNFCRIEKSASLLLKKPDVRAKNDFLSIDIIWAKKKNKK